MKKAICILTVIIMTLSVFTSCMHTHSYVVTQTENATCVSDGRIISTCVECGEQAETVVPKTGVHSFDDGVVLTEATCAAEGEIEYTCSVCGEKKTEVLPLLTEHEFDEGEIITEATCAECGEIVRTCSVCGKTETDEIEKLTTHTFDNGTIIANPTCTDDGKSVYTCTVCGEKKTEIIAALGHDYKTTTVKASCEQAGSVTTECTRCHDKHTDITPATGHSFSAATCTSASVCTICGKQDAPALGHNYVDGVCTRCGEKISAYQYLYNYIVNNGSRSGNGYMVKVVVDSSIDTRFTAYDNGSIMIVVYSKSSGSQTASSITFTETGKNFSATCSFDGGNFTAKGEIIDSPKSTFKTTTTLPLSSYTGNSRIKSSFAELFSTSLHIALMEANKIVLNPAGYSCADFGFTYFTSY